MIDKINIPTIVTISCDRDNNITSNKSQFGFPNELYRTQKNTRTILTSKILKASTNLLSILLLILSILVPPGAYHLNFNLYNNTR